MKATTFLLFQGLNVVAGGGKDDPEVAKNLIKISYGVSCPTDPELSKVAPIGNLLHVNERGSPLSHPSCLAVASIRVMMLWYL